MRVKVSGVLTFFWDDGNFVCDDSFHHRKTALTDLSQAVVRWFATWRELSTVADLALQALPVAERLLEHNILVAYESPEHQEEERILAVWSDWGAAARQFHFASKTRMQAVFLSNEEDEDRLRGKGRRQPAPAAFKAYPDRELVPVPSGPVNDEGWPHRALVEALYERRTIREFDAGPMGLDELTNLLQVVGGTIDRCDHPETGTSLFRTSPFAGARHAIELYVYARRVTGLAQGLYHFAPDRGGLEILRVPCPHDLVDAVVREQRWLGSGAALILYTGVLERLRWKYETPRSYRDLFIGLGHYNQTMYLTATAMGLGAGFATAICDEAAEQLLDIDGSDEIFLAATAIGRRLW
jgi:SagB-type dehydrogenase family enzyme